MFLECCKSSPSSLPSLLSSNVSHIELCSAESLAVGGTTPTPGMLNCCVEQLKQHDNNNNNNNNNVYLTVLVRPRGGNFHYSEVEKHAIIFDLRWICNEDRVDSVSICALDSSSAGGGFDDAFLLDCAKVVNQFGKDLTINRGIDELFRQNYDFARDSEGLFGSLKVRRVLTSGGEGNGVNLGAVAAFKKCVGEEVVVVVAGGVSCDNLGGMMEAMVSENAKCSVDLDDLSLCVLYSSTLLITCDNKKYKHDPFERALPFRTY